MRKLNITKEAFEKSNYFKNKYGTLEYVSESGKVFKTSKGKLLKFKESCDDEFNRYYERMMKLFRYDSGIHIRMRNNEDGSETIEVKFDDRFNWSDDVVSGRIPLDEDSLLLDWITRFDERGHRYGWEFDYEIAKDIEHPIDGGANNDYLARLTLTRKCDKEEDDWLFENSSESSKIFKTSKGKLIKFRESTKKFKESVGDISTDPSYVCPYCDGRNCYFDYAEEVPNDDFFEGATLNTQFWCTDCDKPYNVTYELKVKDVYPIEDADE